MSHRHRVAPPVARKGYHWTNRIRGYLHSRILMRLSGLYCRMFSIRAEPGIFPLPFGLLLKWTDGTREEEALAMMVARDMGLPVPRFLSYGYHDHELPGSILMTRIPGVTLDTVMRSLSESELSTIATELESYIQHMRSFASPYGSSVCGVDGGSIRSPRVSGRLIDPSPDLQSFHHELLVPASIRWWVGKEDRFRQHVATYEKMFNMPHSIVFTHGDLMHHNIMVQDGHITGIIDWEASGWLPEYWEFTTALRGPKCHQEPPWRTLMRSLPSYHYDTEYDCEWSLWQLTQDSFGY